MLVTSISLFLSVSSTPAQEKTRFSILDDQSLMEAREAYRRQDAAILPAVNRLRHDADAALAQLPVSVTLKTQLPSSGDRHDYMSLARYYWLDTTKPEDLPYGSRDGEVNPEIYTIPDASNCGRMIVAVHTLALAYAVLGADQIEPDGSQPLEHRRTTAAHYVLFNLQAFFKLAAVAEHAGIDLWNYQTADHRSIRHALDWTLPYIHGERDWTWKLVKKFEWSEYAPLLKQAASVYKDSSYEAAAVALNSGKILSDRSEILFYRR